MSHTAEYEEFLRSLKGSLSYKDDLALDCYENCALDERHEIDDLLRRDLPKGDPRVARAVALLWPAPQAAEALTNALANAKPADAPAITDALRMLTEGSSLQALRTALFDESSDEADRIRAAEALAKIEGPPAAASLEAAVDEPLSGLRLRAAELLFDRLLLAATAVGPVLQQMLTSKWQAIRDAGITEVKRISQAGSLQAAGSFAVDDWREVVAASARVDAGDETALRAIERRGNLPLTREAIAAFKRAHD
jgi:hypothetical protein